MSKVIIDGIPPYDGEHDIDLGTLTGYELHTIKRVSGLRTYEIDEGLRAGDYDLFVAVAAIALKREGHAHAGQAVEVLLGATLGKMKLILGGTEDDDDDEPESPHEEDGDPVDPPEGPTGPSSSAATKS